MLFNKKNIIMLLAASQVMTSLFAAQPKSLNELYNQLLKNQKNINPILTSSQAEMSSKAAMSQNFYQIFKNAYVTGLNEQYQLLLSQPNSNFSISTFFSPDNLRVVAYMQNTYGQGQPFQYTGSTESQFNPTNNVVVGSYESPKGKIIITRYGFLKGLLDTLTAMKTNTANKNNQFFVKTEKMITDNLKKAIKASSPSNETPYEVAQRVELALETIKNISGVGRRNADIKIMKPIESDLNKIIQKYSKK